MVSRLVVTGAQVVSWVRFGVRGSVSEALKLLHVIGGLHLDQVLSHGNKLVHLTPLSGIYPAVITQSHLVPGESVSFECRDHLIDHSINTTD